jgi:hypothetical protein
MLPALLEVWIKDRFAGRARPPDSGTDLDSSEQLQDSPGNIHRNLCGS